MVKFREFSLLSLKNAKKSEKISPKIQGAPDTDQFRNLSSTTRDLLSPDTDPLGEEIWVVKISSLPLNCPPNGGSYGAKFCIFLKPPLEIYKRRKVRVSSSVNKKVRSFSTLCPLSSGLNMYTYVIILTRSRGLYSSIALLAK